MSESFDSGRIDKHEVEMVSKKCRYRSEKDEAEHEVNSALG